MFNCEPSLQSSSPPPPVLQPGVPPLRIPQPGVLRPLPGVPLPAYPQLGVLPLLTPSQGYLPQKHCSREVHSPLPPSAIGSSHKSRITFYNFVYCTNVYDENFMIKSYLYLVCKNSNILHEHQDVKNTKM